MFKVYRFAFNGENAGFNVQQSELQDYYSFDLGLQRRKDEATQRKIYNFKLIYSFYPISVGADKINEGINGFFGIDISFDYYLAFI